jgi:hypothetical protein
MKFGDNRKNSPFLYIDYDKISDVILWFNRNYYLKLNVRLSRNDKSGNRIPFHSEYKTEYNNNITYSIRRDYSVFFSVECNDKSIADRNYVYLYPEDVYVLNMLINNNILPWFMGDNRIFGKDKENKLYLKYTDVERQYLPLQGGGFLSFAPTVIEYVMDDTCKEGINVGINHDNITFDITVDKFFQFAYILANTDMISAAIGMINYVKVKPWLVNYKDLTKN